MTDIEQKAYRLYLEDVNSEERQGGGWRGLPRRVRDAYLTAVEEKTCLAPPKWRGSDGRCNSCLVCSPEKFSNGN